MSIPTLDPYPLDDVPEGTPQITEIHYDVWTLRITLDFDDWDGVVYLDFESPSGFRVLDEADLPEIWEAKGEDTHWLHVVEENGWLSQEENREGFAQDPSEVREFFVSGENDCVNVLALEEPTVTIVGDDD